MATITAANAVYMLTIFPIFPAPVQLQGFAADDAFSSEAVEVAENVMGVDGNMSSGWVPRMIRQTISIMPDSPSSVLFDQWGLTQDAAREVFPATATILLRSINRKYTLNNGVLTSYPPIVDVKRLLQARRFIIVWGSVNSAVF